MQYACFISFPRGVRAAERLAIELALEMRAALSIFDKSAEVFCCAERDIHEQRWGPHWEDWIPKALCHSACMVAVCPPAYFSSSPGCVREFFSMQKIIEKRRVALATEPVHPHFIHALQLVDDHRLDELANTPVHDFSDYPRQTVPLSRTKAGRNKVSNIAKQVFSAWQLVCAEKYRDQVLAACACDVFELVPLPEKYQRSQEVFPSFGGVRS